MNAKPLVLDGGLATYLQQQGVLQEADPLWSSRLLLTETGRNQLFQAHYRFLESGSDIVTTASYQLSIDLLQECIDNFTESQCIDLMKESVAIARRACEKYWDDIGAEKNLLERIKPMVAGSVGPYGACLRDGSEYSGSYLDSVGSDELKQWHRPRIEALVSAGVDFLACETLPGLSEALAILEVVQETAENQKLWITFTCKEGRFLSHGEDFGSSVATVWQRRSEALLEGVGVNCVDPNDVMPLLGTIPEDCHHVPLVIYPNSGEKWIPRTGWLEDSARASIEDLVPQWRKQHSRIFAVGGCCRVLPEEIRKIRSALQ